MTGKNNQKERIATRIIREFEDGQVINLGVGIPTLIPELLPKHHSFFFHTENGLLGVGPAPPKGEEDWEILNASKQPITVSEGASFFDSVQSFAMIRGGHIDLAVLGALQVSQDGLIANWSVPGEPVLGIGGAMDLISGVIKIIVGMTHLTKEGNSKLVSRLKYPMSGLKAADLIVTDLAVFEVVNERLVLREISSDITFNQLKNMTEADFEVKEPLICF